jgi:hypothetical protein
MQNVQLTDAHSNAQAQNKATLDAPPTSNHFNDDKKIRLPAGSSTALPLPTVHNTTGTPFPGLDPTQTLVQQLLHQNAMVMQMFNPLARGISFPGSTLPFAMAPTPPAGTQSQVPAPGSFSPSYNNNIVQLPRPISLQEFCLRYDVSNSDLQKLESLEVRLGDRVVGKLEPEYWKEAGFSRLG